MNIESLFKSSSSGSTGRNKDSFEGKALQLPLTLATNGQHQSMMDKQVKGEDTGKHSAPDAIHADFSLERNLIQEEAANSLPTHQL